MRKQFYILLSLIFLVSCNKNENETLNVKVSNDNISEVNLTLKDYDPKKNKNFIDIKIENLISPIERQLKISEDGIVNYTFLNNSKKEIIFNYDSRKFSLIISPSEKIDVKLKISELLNWSKFKNVEVSGTNQVTNQLILINTPYLDSLIKQSISHSVKDISLNNLHYKNKRISEMKNHLKLFNSYITEQKITDNTFIDWAKAQIRYKAGTEICIYPFFGKRSKKLTAEDEYFSFINDIQFNANDELIYNSYLDYLKSLATTYNILVNVADAYNDEVELLEKNWPTAYFLKLELVKNLPKGKDREIMIAHLFKNEQRISKHTGNKIPKEYSDSLKLYTSKTLFSQLNQTKKNNTVPIIELIEGYELSQKEKEDLIKIYKETKGKVVFHDFWFANCPPCMKELPNYNKLMEITGDDIAFVMFGVLMDEKGWKKTRAKFNLQGINYLLTKNQLAFFEKYFGVYGFPHHQIVNPNGQIVEEEIPRIYRENFKNLIELIKKHKI